MDACRHPTLRHSDYHDGVAKVPLMHFTATTVTEWMKGE